MEKLGVGKTAEVYKINTNCVAKIFFEGRNESSIENEIQSMQVAIKNGLMVPKFMGRGVIDGRQAIFMEYWNGKSMLDIMMNPNCEFDKLTVDFATTHYIIHRCTNVNVASVGDRLKWQINQTDLLDDSAKDRIIGLMESLPNGNSLCHFDYHLGNIIITNAGMFVIDWCDIGCGNPLFDVARTALIFECTSLPNEIPYDIKEAINLARKSFGEAYIKEYMKISGNTGFNIEPYKVVFAAARLHCEDDENIPIFISIIKRFFKEYV